MLIETIIKWAVPFVCGGIITWAVTYIKLRKKRDSALESGVQCLLRAEIIRNHDKYIDKGYCPIYAKEALKRAYAAYHVLHGNDVATGLYNEVMALPTDPPHEGGNAQ
nr:MAG TPA: hypothetical protein [Caudoviricetes sp.]DAH82226.1 MAG TPA: hypothetical protein [Caudoviricetes sp.]DAH82973.1 MAG TPA: hypothetical protein [Caudoviricetes sp.]DAP40673.1 MAG TPA: hypothetical protein [Caudoviricetes sp.]